MTDPEVAHEQAASPAAGTPLIEQELGVAFDPSSPEPQQQQQQDQLAQPAPFQPIFTLVTDTTTRATHHPRVHYIFSDDDPDILTEALTNHHQIRAAAEHARGPSPGSGSTGPSSNSNSSSSNSRPAERAVVLDLVPRANDGPDAGYEVAWASSLSSDWAVVSAKVSSLQGEDAGITTGADDQDDGGHKLILRIEGIGYDDGLLPGNTSARATGKSAASMEGGGELHLSSSGGKQASSSSASGQQQQEDYGALIDEFEKRMGVLRKVVDAGEERQRKVLADAEAEAEVTVDTKHSTRQLPTQAMKQEELVNKEDDGGD